MPYVMVQMPQTEKQIPDSYSATISNNKFQEKNYLCFWVAPAVPDRVWVRA